MIKYIGPVLAVCVSALPLYVFVGWPYAIVGGAIVWGAMMILMADHIENKES